MPGLKTSEPEGYFLTYKKLYNAKSSELQIHNMLKLLGLQFDLEWFTIPSHTDIEEIFDVIVENEDKLYELGLQLPRHIRRRILGDSYTEDVPQIEYYDIKKEYTEKLKDKLLNNQEEITVIKSIFTKTARQVITTHYKTHPCKDVLPKEIDEIIELLKENHNMVITQTKRRNTFDYYISINN